MKYLGALQLSVTVKRFLSVLNTRAFNVYNVHAYRIYMYTIGHFTERSILKMDSPANTYIKHSIVRFESNGFSGRHYRSIKFRQSISTIDHSNRAKSVSTVLPLLRGRNCMSVTRPTANPCHVLHTLKRVTAPITKRNVFFSVCSTGSLLLQIHYTVAAGQSQGNENVETTS